MQPLLIILLLLSVLTNVLLILLLLRSGQQNTAEDQTDEIARIVRDEVEAETEVLADQLRVMQGEVTRTTSASARDMGTLLAESQRQSQEAATARLDAIDRAGAARQRAANDALLAQLQVLETRLKNLEDTNANRLDGVRATLLQGMANIRADNNKKLDEIRGTVDEKLESTLQRRVSESFRAVSTQLEQVYKGLGEMDPKQLASTTMDPKTRILQRVSIEDAVVADRAVRELMGSEVGYRREYIEKHAHDARFLDA